MNEELKNLPNGDFEVIRGKPALIDKGTLPNTQPFETFPKLAECLLHAAHHWKVDGGNSWNKTLSEINKVCKIIHNHKGYLQHRLETLKANTTMDATQKHARIREVKKMIDRLNTLTGNIKNPNN